MTFLKKQIDQALLIVAKYQGNLPFHLYIKEIFRNNKNWGSKDRKNYRNICYTYFRNYQILKDLNPDEKSQWIFENLSITENKTFNTQAYSFLEGHISQQIDIDLLNIDFAQEPDIFFRTLPKYETIFLKDLENREIEIKKIDDVSGVYSLPSKIDIESHISRGHGYIQDLACQLAIQELSKHSNLNSVWDCCSGAGGKSLDIALKHPTSRIFCSDKRGSILQNLKLRFKTLGLKIPDCQEIDLLKDLDDLNDGFLNQKLVIADLPCTGSGTWRRNPENIVYFNEANIQTYANLQYQIISGLDRFISKDGLLYYMTCSIFKSENETNVLKFIQPYGYEIVFEKYFGGTHHGSDTIYGCLLRKK